MGEVTLELYKVQERNMAMHEARKGLWIHAIVTVIVVLALVAVNVFVASEFPWAVFPAVGMAIGVWFHWNFGVRHGDEMVRHHQAEVEREARRLAA